jgi:pimeloyl-ACP methyl ester carboxylesterase
MPEETIRHVNFQGFGYRCRTVRNPAPRTEPIVVLGGAFQDMYAWRRLEGPWVEAATVITPELPGSGSADHLPGHYGFDFLAEALGDFLEQSSVGPVNLFGASYGAPISYLLAQRRPDLVARLVLLGAALEYPEHGRGGLRTMADNLSAGNDPRAYGDATVRALMSSPERFVRNRAVVARILSQAMSGLSTADAPRHLALLHRLLAFDRLPGGGIAGVRALCVTGECDEFTTPEHVRSVAATIEDATFTTIREADHLPNLERPREVSRLVAAYFTDQPLDAFDFLTPLEHPAAYAVS